MSENWPELPGETRIHLFTGFMHSTDDCMPLHLYNCRLLITFNFPIKQMCYYILLH